MLYRYSGLNRTRPSPIRKFMQARHHFSERNFPSFQYHALNITRSPVSYNFNNADVPDTDIA